MRPRHRRRLALLPLALVPLALSAAACGKPASAPALAAPADPAPRALGTIDGTCAAIRAELRAALAKWAQIAPRLPTVDTLLDGLAPIGTCIDAGAAGAWIVTLPDPGLDTMTELTEVDGEPEETPVAIGVRDVVTVVFVTPDGARHPVPDPVGRAGVVFDRMVDDAGLEWVPNWPHFPSAVTATTARVSPDAIPELVVQNGEQAMIATWDGARAAVYAPAEGVLPDVTGVADVDGDGRLDLVDALAYHFNLYGDGNFTNLLDVFARGLPDGTFTTDDPGTRAHYETMCHGLGRSPWLLGRVGGELLENVACAHLLGVSAAAIDAAMARELAVPDDAASAGFEDFDLAGIGELVHRERVVTIGRDDGLVPLTPSGATATSTEADYQHYTFAPAEAIDGDLGSAWQAKKGATAPTLTLSYARPVTVVAVEIADGFQRQDGLGDLFLMNQRATRVRIMVGAEAHEAALDPTARGWQKIALPGPATGDVVRVMVLATAPGSRWQQVAISDVRALGPPAAAK
ncbi:MAG: discoidin domain-containing protein [Deltaproteobacteria bacterium]|nr:discoidin domain-containing protein [Deltaproteobacteria bacterium]